MDMKKTIAINAAILISCIPLSAVVAWLALLVDVGPRYVGYSTLGMIVHHVLSPVTSGILTTHDWRHNIIHAGPPLLFLLIAVVAVIKGWKKTSFTFSVLTSLWWVLLVMLTIYVMSMP